MTTPLVSAEPRTGRLSWVAPAIVIRGASTWAKSGQDIDRITLAIDWKRKTTTSYARRSATMPPRCGNSGTGSSAARAAAPRPTPNNLIALRTTSSKATSPQLSRHDAARISSQSPTKSEEPRNHRLGRLSGPHRFGGLAWISTKIILKTRTNVKPAVNAR